MLLPDTTVYYNGEISYEPESVIQDELGKRRYELTNHLGNVQAVINDRKLPETQTTLENTTFATDANGWLPCGQSTLTYNSGTQSIDITTNTLSNNCAYKVFTTFVPGETYTVTITASKGTAPNLELFLFGVGTYPILDGITTDITFTASSSSMALIVRPTDFLSSYSYSIHDVKLTTALQYEAVVMMTSDYYPFGMAMPGRQNVNISNSEDYRYAYNGMEQDNEVSGNGNSYTTEFRQYDPRLGRWKSLDPLMHQFPWMSPYVAFDNNPIYYNDPYGLSAGEPEKAGTIDGEIVNTGTEENPENWLWNIPSTGEPYWEKVNIIGEVTVSPTTAEKAFDVLNSKSKNLQRMLSQVCPSCPPLLPAAATAAAVSSWRTAWSGYVTNSHTDPMGDNGPGFGHMRVIGWNVDLPPGGDVSGLIHSFLDVLGMVPVVGEIFDALNGAIYAAEGDMMNAGISWLAILPIGGQALTGTRLVTKAASEVVDDVAEGISKNLDNVVEGATKAYTPPPVKAFDKAGIEYTEHFATRVKGRSGRGITGRKALDAYNNGRLYYNPATKNYIRHNSRTGISVVVDKKVGGKAITVFEGNASPTWVPIRNQK